MNSKTRFLVRMALAVIAGSLLVVSLRLPLWQMRMEAPQYRGPEALKVIVRPGSLAGNLSEIKILNQYIGVTIPDTLPQTRWLPVMLWLGACLGIVAVALPLRGRRIGALAVAALIAGALIVAAAQAQWQMYHIGHERNRHAALEGIQDFTPPLMGSKRLAQFELTSSLGLGSLCISAAVAFYTAAGLIAFKQARSTSRAQLSVQSEPRPSDEVEATL